MKQEEQPVDDYLTFLSEKFGEVLRYKKSYPNSRGEFILYLELANGKYTSHDCEYGWNGDFVVHTNGSMTKDYFERIMAEED